MLRRLTGALQATRMLLCIGCCCRLCVFFFLGGFFFDNILSGYSAFRCNGETSCVHFSYSGNANINSQLPANLTT
jgi:hypothetical protein